MSSHRLTPITRMASTTAEQTFSIFWEGLHPLFEACESDHSFPYVHFILKKTYFERRVILPSNYGTPKCHRFFIAFPNNNSQSAQYPFIETLRLYAGDKTFEVFITALFSRSGLKPVCPASKVADRKATKIQITTRISYYFQKYFS